MSISYQAVGGQGKNCYRPRKFLLTKEEFLSEGPMMGSTVVPRPWFVWYPLYPIVFFYFYISRT